MLLIFDWHIQRLSPSYERNGFAVVVVFAAQGSCRIWLIVGRGGAVAVANGFAEYDIVAVNFCLY